MRVIYSRYQFFHIGVNGHTAWKCQIADGNVITNLGQTCNIHIDVIWQVCWEALDFHRDHWLNEDCIAPDYRAFTHNHKRNFGADRTIHSDTIEIDMQNV